MNNGGRLVRRQDRLRKKRDVAEKQIGFASLKVVCAVKLARHIARKRKHRGVIAARL